MVIQAMLKSRSAVLLSYQTAQTQLESRQAKVAELQGKPNKAQALAAAEAAVATAQAEADNAQRELTRVTDLTLHEVISYQSCFIITNVIDDMYRS
jgi:multidrug resistance efflux pump